MQSVIEIHNSINLRLRKCLAKVCLYYKKQHRKIIVRVKFIQLFSRSSYLEGSTVCDGALMAKSIETTFDDTSEAASSAEVSSAKAVAGTVVSAVSLLNSGVA
ncbi:MAG: hypothetical protein ACLRMX_08200 [Lachnospira eligens]